MICTVCWFPRFQYLCHSWFQAIDVKLLNAELWRDAKLAPACMNQLQSITVRTKRKHGVLYLFFVDFFHGRKKNSALTGRSTLHTSTRHHSHLCQESCTKCNCSQVALRQGSKKLRKFLGKCNEETETNGWTKGQNGRAINSQLINH